MSILPGIGVFIRTRPQEARCACLRTRWFWLVGASLLCLSGSVQERLIKLLPCWITAGVVAVLCAVLWAGFFERLELLTFDLRAKAALRFPFPLATNLAVIELDEPSLDTLNQAEFGQYTFPLPRGIYGRVVQELKAQGAIVVAMDLFFLELNRDYVENRVDGLSSDEYFARKLAEASNVVLATPPAHLSPTDIKLAQVPDLFRTNALAVGHDGVRGRGSIGGVYRKATAFVDDKDQGQRVWHLGIVMAASALGLDLDHARVEPGRIVLTNRAGLRRVIPVDSANRFYIDWNIRRPQREPSDRVFGEAFAKYYLGNLLRETGRPFPSDVHGRMVLIAYAAAGRSAMDWGPTPLGENTPLYLSHLTTANALLVDRFIRRTGVGMVCLLIIGMAVVAALAGWRLRPWWGLAAIASLCVLYGALALWVYVAHRYWLPFVGPVGGAVVMTYVCLLSWRMVVEHNERWRMHKAFGRLVSPSVFSLVSNRPFTSFGGARCKVTIYFADVRGFTRFVEEQHERTLAQLRLKHLEGPAAESLDDLESRETIEIVNLYLALIADLVKAHDGTLDKYIGDCVMAFWGAPVANEDHALAGVNAAIAIHRAVHSLNNERLAENERRQQENMARKSAGKAPLDLLPILRVGSAMNSGVVTAGFMGSESHISNYTVFGREVNITSRLENAVGAVRRLGNPAPNEHV